MPQLEQISSFAGQIFWLFVCFGVIYFFLSKFAVPKLSGVIESREGTISSNVQTAHNSSEEAKTVRAELEFKIANARQKALERTSQSAKASASLYSQGIAESDEELKKYIESTEKEISLKSKEAEKEVSENISGFVEALVLKLAGTKLEDGSVAKKVAAKANLKKIVG